MSTNEQTVIIRFIKAKETWTLRHSVLRPHQQLEDVDYPNDRNPESFHLGAFSGEALIAVGSFYKEKHEALTGWIQWRLRGMAVDPAHRSRQVGSALLAFAMDELRGRKVDTLWCHARETATRFYLKHGFRTHGHRFNVEGIGPHFVMYRKP